MSKNTFFSNQRHAIYPPQKISWYWVAFTCVCLITFSRFWYDRSQRYDHTYFSETLFPPPEQVVSVIASTTQEQDALQWTAANTTVLGNERMGFVPYGTLSFGHTYHTNTRELLNVSYLLQEYSSVTDAAITYHMLQPPGQDQKKVVWTPMSALSKYAQEEKTACVMEKAGNCQIWYRWYRYGQYILRIQISSPKERIPGESVQLLANLIEPYVARHFKRSF